MPRYYLNIRDGRTIVDEEGQEFANLADAREEAIASARSILRDAIWEGRLPLNDHIEIVDEGGMIAATVAFKEVVRIE